MSSSCSNFCSCRGKLKLFWYRCSSLETNLLVSRYHRENSTPGYIKYFFRMKELFGWPLRRSHINRDL